MVMMVFLRRLIPEAKHPHTRSQAYPRGASRMEAELILVLQPNVKLGLRGKKRVCWQCCFGYLMLVCDLCVSLSHSLSSFSFFGLFETSVVSVLLGVSFRVLVALYRGEGVAGCCKAF